MNTQLQVWFERVPESQYLSIIENLGADFLTLRLENCLDMLVPTEILDDLFAMLVICNGWFRRMTCFQAQPLEFSSYPAILNKLSTMRINQTDDVLKSRYLLDAKSRIQFYEMAQRSYLAWNSSLVRSVNLLTSFLTNG